MSTVSKTTNEIVHGLRSGYFSPSDVLEACLKLEALALRSDLSEHDLSLAQQATAELQEENTRLRERIRAMAVAFARLENRFGDDLPEWSEVRDAIMGAELNPPKGGAVQKGLSKEKAK